MPNAHSLQNYGWLLVKGFFGLAFTLLLARCSDPLNTAGDVEPTFSSLYSKLFSTECASCHQPGGSGYVAGAPLDFSSTSTGYFSLFQSVGGASNSGTCGSLSNVAAGSPSQSYLMGVVSSQYYEDNFGGVSGCTPINTHINGVVNLSTSEQAALEQWIQSGAANN
ncbi:MAG: c-type cytochrome [Pseudobdellovibrionaceae bacterium]|nr:c-type cytochrome [Bdellovibrionales bacterium]USN47553.1 MAG: c-type cytochrome [Pseudobdellovibrionaceae bacterium]